MSKNKRIKLKRIKNIVSKYINSLENCGFPIDKAFLFGSYARGDFRKDSDIDLAIVSKKLARNREKNEKFLWHQVIDVDPRIEPVGYAPKDFNLSDPLVWEIKEEGVKIR